MRSQCTASSRASARSVARNPPFQALRDAFALPSGVRGPVECSQGRKRLIASACRARRSSVHPLPLMRTPFSSFGQTSHFPHACAMAWQAVC